MQNVSYYIIIAFILIVFIYSFIKRNNAYESFIRGCKENMKVGISILPYLLVMYVAINVFKASMVTEDVIRFDFMPNEILVQGFFRPVSSHASLSLMINTITKYGVDSKEGIISAILQGGSDTTFYVMGLYFGLTGIKRTRHAYIVGIICDVITFLLCIFIFYALF